MRSLFSSLHLSLNIFEGPLDVLVHLIHRREVHSRQVHLNEVFKSLYKDLLDLEVASHFLEQFTHLMLFKSRECLPFEEKESSEALRRPEEAIAHLADYYQFKEMATVLDHRQEEEACRFSRGYKENLPNIAPPVGIEQLSLDHLQEVFKKVLDRLPQNPHQILKDPWSVEDGKQWIYRSLDEKSELNLPQLLLEIDSRAFLIVIFLAFLELMKEGSLFVKADYKIERLIYSPYAAASLL